MRSNDFEPCSKLFDPCFCYKEPEYDQICHLFPLPEAAQDDPKALCPKSRTFDQKIETLKNQLQNELTDICTDNPAMRFLCNALGLEIDDELSIDDKWNDYQDYRVPFVDLDDDGYGSRTGGLRGTWWKGKDCNDADINMYPGRKVLPFDLFGSSLYLLYFSFLCVYMCYSII